MPNLIPGLKSKDIPLNPNGIGYCPNCGAHGPITDVTCQAVDCERVSAEPKHYCYGSGMFGCLYDYGPHFCENIEDAIDDLAFIFEDSISSDELIEMRSDLLEDRSHKFKNARETGAQYCEIRVQCGIMPVRSEYGDSYEEHITADDE